MGKFNHNLGYRYVDFNTFNTNLSTVTFFYIGSI